MGLILAESSVLLLPLDVANRATNGRLQVHHPHHHRAPRAVQLANHQQMDILLAVVYLTMAGWIILVIPFALFYYESDDPDATSYMQCTHSMGRC